MKKLLLTTTALITMAFSALAMPMTEENLTNLVQQAEQRSDYWTVCCLTTKWDVVTSSTNLVYSESVGYLINRFNPKDTAEMSEKIAIAYTNEIAKMETLQTNVIYNILYKYWFDKYFDANTPATIYDASVYCGYVNPKADFVDRLLYALICYRPSFDGWLLDETVRKTKEYRIRNLLPIVTKDGINPIEESMKPIVTALNAPLLVGFEDAYAAIGYEFNDAQKNILNQYRDYVTSIRDDLLFRIDKLQLFEQIILQTYYGIDEYNNIIKKLNGDE